MPSIFISYIVPCYNVRNYLPACIESLRKQKIQAGEEVEFILVNDGSTDDTLSIIKQFAEEDSRAVVVDQENQGVCAARNNGLAQAKGRFVFFVDGDDCMTDDASDVIYSFCKDNPLDVVLFGNYKRLEGQVENQVWMNPAKYIKPGIYTKEDYINQATCFPISCKLYRRDFLESNKIRFDRQLVAGEVYTFYIHSLVLAANVGVSPDFIMYYMKRKGESATTVINVNRDLSILDTLHVANGYVNAYCPCLMEKHAYLAPLFWLVTSFFMIKYVGRTPYTKEIGRLIRTVKSDGQYRTLLKYLTGKGLSASQHSLLALCIRFFPSRVAYAIIRGYYRLAA